MKTVCATFHMHAHHAAEAAAIFGEKLFVMILNSFSASSEGTTRIVSPENGADIQAVHQKRVALAARAIDVEGLGCEPSRGAGWAPAVKPIKLFEIPSIQGSSLISDSSMTSPRLEVDVSSICAARSITVILAFVPRAQG